MSETDPATEGVASLGYAEAMAELDAILVEIDHDEVDLDHLATRMRRAAALVDHCRGRIADARVDVERVAADLSTLEQTSGPVEDQP